MTGMIRTVALSLVCFASSLAGQGSLADPLHKVGNEGSWVHVDSGWMFPKDVAGLARVTQPYNIDGSDDAGAEYRQAPGGLKADVEIYAADSAATGATLEGAKTDAASKAGEAAQAEPEEPFRVETMKDASAVKVTYVATGESAGSRVNLYFSTTERWRVKVVASTQDRGKNAEQALDAFVRALPWHSLGTESGLH